MFNKVKQLLQSKEKKPLHLAITMNGIKQYSEENNLSLEKSYDKSFEILCDIIKFQIERNIRILSIYMMPMKETLEITDQFIDFLQKLQKSDIINSNQIKVSVLGKWYDLPSRAIDPIKGLLSETKDYDKFFLNLCINYNGQEELVDAAKIIAKKVLSEKIDPENINKETIKENLYSSYFLPPNIIIKTGLRKVTHGFLLWDSISAHIYFTDKLFPDISTDDIIKGINDY